MDLIRRTKALVLRILGIAADESVALVRQP
jgi:hypothetical protein